MSASWTTPFCGRKCDSNGGHTGLQVSGFLALISYFNWDQWGCSGLLDVLTGFRNLGCDSYYCCVATVARVQ